MLKKLLIAVAVLAVLLLLVSFLLPTEFHLSRSTVIRAERAKIHALVGDLKAWDSWTPFKEVQPSVVTTLGPTTTGVGASQSWTSDEGPGRLVFTECDPATGVRYDLVFINGERETLCKSWILYADRDGGTEVTWGLEGDMNMPVVGGWFALLSNTMMGPIFEKGLEKLNLQAEAQ